MKIPRFDLLIIGEVASHASLIVPIQILMVMKTQSHLVAQINDFIKANHPVSNFRVSDEVVL